VEHYTHYLNAISRGKLSCSEQIFKFQYIAGDKEIDTFFSLQMFLWQLVLCVEDDVFTAGALSFEFSKWRNKPN
jgi:hypothetical protein